MFYSSYKFSNIYKYFLNKLKNNYQYDIDCRDLKTYELLNINFLLKNPINCLYYNKRRSSQLDYIIAELQWYFSGRNDLDFIKKYAKFWEQITNKDNTINSAYGFLLFNKKNEYNYTQYKWAINSLIKDKNTRQAIMFFNQPAYQYDDNKDFICTLHAWFYIRDNKLNMNICMRSSDIILGLPTDVPFFCLLQQQVFLHLKETYKDLQLGVYNHSSYSLHIYEKHFKLLNEILENDFLNKQMILKENIININGEYLNKNIEKCIEYEHRHI